MMSQEEIQKSVEGVMALRPAGTKPRTTEPKRPSQLKRMSDAQFQQELAAIMRDEECATSVNFFSNSDASKGGRKNLKFNPYVGQGKK
ncbi:hypothetical protein [Vibrio vulnificus]|uniref:hypothetical protein n=1 Tax=Vibrio vulnificus TaxID=672 RepID=UPI00102BD2F6|nr:hypothetical protein [Vibrio vulnificus]MCA3991406.1 hypothetical protein [Vibrio vulnificus]RZQ90304.1 hypothetical protein D8T27_04430 [Vibrio vulnificus]